MYTGLWCYACIFFVSDLLLCDSIPFFLFFPIIIRNWEFSVCLFFSFLVVFETKLTTSFRILLVKAFVIKVRFVYIKERLSTFDFLFIRKVAWMFSIKCETSNSNFFRQFSLFSILPVLGPWPQWCRFEQNMLKHRIESNLSFLGHLTGGILFCNLIILLWLEIEYDSMGDWKSWEEE